MTTSLSSLQLGFATPFTTGDAADGYNLQDVVIRMGGFDSGDTVEVKIYTSGTSSHADGGAAPDTELHTMTNPASLPSTDDQELTFEAPANATLEASTTYWLVVERTGGTFTIARDDDDSQIGQPGWSIGNDSRRRATDTWSNAEPSDQHMLFAVRGTDRSAPPEVALVTNIDTTTGAATYTTSTDEGVGVSFRTGNNTNGYTVDSVKAMVSRSNADSALRVRIYNHRSDGFPDTVKHTLTNPETVSVGSTPQEHTFTAPAGARLQTNTTYWIVVERSSGSIRVGTTTSTAQTGQPGWSIGDESLGLRAIGGSIIEAVPRIEVTGQVNEADTITPTLDATNSHVTEDGTDIVLVFDEDINETTANLPPLSAFSATANDETVTLESLEVSTEYENRIILNLPDGDYIPRTTPSWLPTPTPPRATTPPPSRTWRATTSPPSPTRRSTTTRKSWQTSWSGTTSIPATTTGTSMSTTWASPPPSPPETQPTDTTSRTW